MTKGFEGWYFKHQKGDDVLAFIPGLAMSGAFVQVISESTSRQYKIKELSVRNGIIRADNCIFSKRGCRIDLPGVKGQIKYQNITPLRSDIMGPFQYLPMQCSHGVISMHHSTKGNIYFNERLHNFDGGTGYIEKDSGKSFPRSYMWLQCNDLPGACSIMLSIAHIPFCGISFTGCICAIMYQACEYRLATYNGVRIRAYEPDYICLTQGKLLLEITINPSDKDCVLKSPVKGKMSGRIRESSNAVINVRLCLNKTTLFNYHSNHAMYEYVK